MTTTRRESTRFYNQLAAQLRADPSTTHRVHGEGRIPHNVGLMLRKRGLEVTVSQQRGDYPYLYITVLSVMDVPQYIATQEPMAQ